MATVSWLDLSTLTFPGNRDFSIGPTKSEQLFAEGSTAPKVRREGPTHENWCRLLAVGEAQFGLKHGTCQRETHGGELGRPLPGSVKSSAWGERRRECAECGVCLVNCVYAVVMVGCMLRIAVIYINIYIYYVYIYNICVYIYIYIYTQYTSFGGPFLRHVESEWIVFPCEKDLGFPSQIPCYPKEDVESTYLAEACGLRFLKRARGF